MGEPVNSSREESTCLLEQQNEQGSRQYPENKFSTIKLKFIKYSALSCVLLLSFGSHYAAHTIGTLKPILKEKLKISNTQYGSLQSSVSLINTIIPIFGGAFIDYFGTSYGSLFSTTMIATGSVVVALSSNIESFPTMALGRILYGIGSGTIVTVQETIIAHWFAGKNLGYSMGVKLAVSRIGSFLAIATVIPITEHFGFYGYSLWFAGIVCLLSLAINGLYVILARKMPSGAANQSLSKKRFSVSDLLRYPAMLWMFMLCAFVLSGSWTAFTHINVELIKLNFGKSDRSAAFYASISQIGPFFIPPLLGVFIDKVGKRPAIALITSAAFVQSMQMLGFTDLSPALGMSLFSLSMSMGPVVMTSSIPMLLPANMLGTALGMYKSAMNVGTSIDNVLLGKLQDYGHNYDYCMKFLTVCGIVSVIATFGICSIDKREYNGMLSSPSKEKRSDDDNEKEKLLLAQPGIYSYIFLSIAAFLLIASWVLSIYGFF